MDAAEERRFRESVSARSPALMRLAYLLTGGDQHAAEDLLQTALARTVARWRSCGSRTRSSGRRRHDHRRARQADPA
ncbi:hypothetical protein [Streptosporangium roseum]|uniref:hypothetical protein n=1 Tax=Streptosporangium roseum TaxID=2001 RepID=UPI003D9DC1D7